MQQTFANSSFILALLVLGCERTLAYPQKYVEAVYSPQRYAESERQETNATSGSSVYASLPVSLSNTLDKGIKVLTEVSKDAQTTINYLTGVALKIEGIFSGLVHSLSGGPNKSVEAEDIELEARLD